MKRTTWVVAGALTAGLLGGGAGIAIAAGQQSGGDTPISGEPLAKAEKAALAHTGGGKVTGTETGDEDGAYEVEVTKDDGTVVDVHLDKDFTVITTKSDTEEHDGQETGGEHQDGPETGGR
jgi:hypothetical protein